MKKVSSPYHIPRGSFNRQICRLHFHLLMPEMFPINNALRIVIECKILKKSDSIREEPLMTWGGARAKAGKKTSTATRPEKKSSTASCRGKNKINANSLPEAPPDH